MYMCLHMRRPEKGTLLIQGLQSAQMSAGSDDITSLINSSLHIYMHWDTNYLI